MPAPYRIVPPIGSRATLGLIALRSDETIEHDYQRFFQAADIAAYVTRIPSAPEVTDETLRQMEADLPGAAGLLPPSVSFDVVGYGCTSGSTLIGPDRVAELVKGSTDTKEVANPLTAAIAAFKALGVGPIGLVSPYVEDVSEALRVAFKDAGHPSPAFVSFDEKEEAKVARIDPQSIFDAAVSVGKASNVDAVFLSCTNLRTLDIIAAAEAEIGKPVVSSNQALFWHMAKLAGVEIRQLPFGRLMRA